MRKSTIAIASACSTLVALTAPAATAAPAVDIYSGTWQTASRCSGPANLDGHWRVVLKHDGTATMTLNVSIEDGEDAGHHASWGYGKFLQQETSAGQTFNIAWGGTQFVLTGQQLTYTISGFPCGTVTLIGTAGS